MWRAWNMVFILPTSPDRTCKKHTTKYKITTRSSDVSVIYIACSIYYRPVCFVFENAKAPRHFLLAPNEEIVNFYISRAPRQ